MKILNPEAVQADLFFGGLCRFKRLGADHGDWRCERRCDVRTLGLCEWRVWCQMIDILFRGLGWLKLRADARGV